MATGAVEMTSPHVLILADKRYRRQAQPNGVASALGSFGAEVVVLDETETEGSDWGQALRWADVVVARGRQPGTLAALDSARRAGVPILDSAAAVEGVRDKRLMTRTLLNAGIPTPRTIIGGLRDVLASDLRFPIILKPIFGDNSQGLVVVENLEELSKVEWNEPEVLAQEYHLGPGVDLKLYVIDDSVTAIRKASPITPCTAKDLGPTDLTIELCHLADCCREAFGLRFFGVDCLDVDGEIKVLEVNDFPNYSSVPHASELLALRIMHKIYCPPRPDALPLRLKENEDSDADRIHPDPESPRRAQPRHAGGVSSHR